MESHPHTIFVLNDLIVDLHHLAARSTCHQKLHFHISKLQKVRFFYVAAMINSFSIQDNQGCESLGAGTQPHHHFVSGNYCFCMTPSHPHRHQYNLLPTHLHFDNSRLHQCQRIFRQKIEFLRCLFFRNLFKASLQTIST